MDKTILFEIPRGRENRPLMTFEQMEKFVDFAREALPSDYICITVLSKDIEIIEPNNEKGVIITKIPLDRNGEPVASAEVALKFTKAMEARLSQKYTCISIPQTHVIMSDDIRVQNKL